jgi:hypothetical protein
MVGGKGSGMNAQYPLGVRSTRPGDALEKSLGSTGVKSENKDIFYCHFNPKVQIKQSVICTFLTTCANPYDSTHLRIFAPSLFGPDIRCPSASPSSITGVTFAWLARVFSL